MLEGDKDQYRRKSSEAKTIAAIAIKKGTQEMCTTN